MRRIMPRHQSLKTETLQWLYRDETKTLKLPQTVKTEMSETETTTPTYHNHVGQAGTCYSAALHQLVSWPATALQSRKWQLIGMSWWYCGALCGHPLPVIQKNRTHGAAHRHTSTSISHTRPSPHSPWANGLSSPQNLVILSKHKNLQFFSSADTQTDRHTHRQRQRLTIRIS